ncbi:MAG: M14 family zinc carboxypeptidase [Terriglobales bacterium]
MRRFVLLVCVTAVLAAAAAQSPAPQSAHGVWEQVFSISSSGWMLRDANHDGLADTIAGHIVVPAQPTEAENAAAANFAARLAHGTLGLTPPLVVRSASAAAGIGPHIYIGAGSVPTSEAAAVRGWTFRLEPKHGRVALLEPGTRDHDLIVVGDAAGMTAAADAFTARAPFLWEPGKKAAHLDAIAAAVNAVAPTAKVQLVGLDYLAGQNGIDKAYLVAQGPITAAELAEAFASGHLAPVHELFVLGGAAIIAINPKPFHAHRPVAATPASAPSPAGARANAGSGDENSGNPISGGGVDGLDLAKLYTSKGLFGPSGPVPVPATLKAHLYVPAGVAGVAMANVAARMGLESLGVTLPLASPAREANLKKISADPVAAGDNALTAAIEKKIKADDSAAAQANPPLAAGEGELRIMDRSVGSHPAVLAQGDAQGQAAALALLADHLPNIWRVGKQYDSLENVRYDLHRFFSLHSGVGQAAAGLFFLHRWLAQIGTASVSNVHAELYADLVDPKLAGFMQQQIQGQLHVPVTVTAASLRAGTRCCDANPDLHYDNPEFPFHQAQPTFSQDIHIPWEGTALLDDVRGAAAKLHPGQPVTLEARVSEGPAERQQLSAQLRDILLKAGADPAHTSVTVLDAYKQGYSWLHDVIGPELAALQKQGHTIAKLDIASAKDVDETGIRDMYSPARWVQELYPVDEVLARQIPMPLAGIHLSEFDDSPAVETPLEIAMLDPKNTAPRPTYRVRAYDASGKVLLDRSFSVHTVMQPYTGVMPTYEQVQVDTGWVRMAQGSEVLLDQRIETDIEKFWHEYQTVTLPRIYRFILAQAHGHLRPEYVPPFDTLRMDFHLSEPNYNIGIDKERISSIEALQEDVFYSTETFLDTLGDLENGRPEDYVGRIIPVMHPSRDGQDGEVKVDFYAKAAPNPLVSLSWSDAQGKPHKELRNLPVLSGAFQPRLLAARVRAGQPGVEDLVWLLPADEMNYDIGAWEKLEPRERLESSMFTVEQARGELHWLDAMHAVGIYPDQLAYPDLHHMQIELALPRPLGVSFKTPERRVLLSWSVSPPEHPRPQISAIAPIATPPGQKYFVQWRQPIGPAESAAILARLAQYPGVVVYSMGRTYLGQVIWAADIMLPNASTLISWPKETTWKASIVYSARQHANEVSSTSHVDRLAELLVSDPAYRKYLRQVNVVLHPIDNPDGAKLSVIEAKIMPDNLLHLGYHGALAADVSSGQGQVDPVYPESRTRRLLLQQWNPDAFLNPHGYPSHEWVQPFSEYSGWVQSRDGANNGRTWWIPRGWFTSLGYARDDTKDTYSKAVTFALRDRIVAAERAVPGLLPLETRMNARYQRWGQAFQPDDMQQPVVDGIRIYMALKGATGKRPGMAGAGANSLVTWDQGYTEAPDETAHNAYMKLVASAGFAYDLVHLNYLAQGKLRMVRTNKAGSQGVSWLINRTRPILPRSEPAASGRSGKAAQPLGQ